MVRRKTSRAADNGAASGRRSGGRPSTRKLAAKVSAAAAEKTPGAEITADEEPPAAAIHPGDEDAVRVRRMHRRDLLRVWEFLKMVFRDVNRETVEYQRPRTRARFMETYEEEGVEQLIFEANRDGKDEIAGYVECAFEVTGEDNWINERYFTKRDMRPLYVEELAVHPDYQGRGLGAYILDQLEHLARVRGRTHLVLEVAENNERALKFYRSRNFYQIDAAIFLAKKVQVEEELLPPRKLRRHRANRKNNPVKEKP
ncbi:MAG: hypothetical protein GMKNLPBB_02893 [Myxococcota bacterium]|nr:hypothetical protein [Myxococcota bacterium]